MAEKAGAEVSVVLKHWPLSPVKYLAPSVWLSKDNWKRPVNNAGNCCTWKTGRYTFLEYRMQQKGILDLRPSSFFRMFACSSRWSQPELPMFIQGQNLTYNVYFMLYTSLNMENMKCINETQLLGLDKAELKGSSCPSAGAEFSLLQPTCNSINIFSFFCWSDTADTTQEY